MKSGTNDLKDAEVAELNEKAKKLYRYVSDVARRIDEATTASLSVADLFTTNIQVQRQKLKDNCEKLMFLDLINYGKKSLELLWRKVYYECIALAKKFRDTDSQYENLTFTHIVMGIGHFHNLITKIQSETKLSVKDLDYSYLFDDEDENDIIADSSYNELGISLLHSCLIYLGDLTRYQTEMTLNIDPSIAARYYLQAAQINMSSGMPYNQLGNLYVDKNYNIDSVCFYIQCLSCDDPFEGAIGNLTKLFEKNNEYSEALNDSDALTQNDHIHASVSNFLSLIEIWYLGKNDDDIPKRCNIIAHQLKESMEFKPPTLPDYDKNYQEYNQVLEDETISPSYLNTGIIYRIIQICLFTVAKLSDTDEKKAFACKAFTLALLSQLLQKQLKDLLSFGFKNPAEKYRKHSATIEEIPEKKVKETSPEVHETELNGSKEVNEKEEEDKHVDIDDDIKPQNGVVKPISKKTSKRRRRRRIAGSESSEDSDVNSESSNSETENTFSDSEDLSDSSFDSNEEAKSDLSTDDENEDSEAQKHNGNLKLENPEPIATEIPKLNGDIKENLIQNTVNDEPKNDLTKNDLKTTEIQSFLEGNNILASLKLLQDWVLNEKDLILSCGESGQALFQSVVDLRNIFMLYFNPTKKFKVLSCDVLDYAKELAKNLELEYKTIPLSEDISLRGTNICKFDKDAAEWQTLNKFKPSVYEENVMRILNFIEFGNQIANIVPRIRLNRTMQILYIKKVPAPKVRTKLQHKQTREWHNSKTKPTESSEGDIRRRLGRQYLNACVRDLERRSPAAPTLLALDAAAMYKHLRRVKHLVKAGVFIVLVPTVVLQELDDLKREERSARVAIRWLEAQLQGGSRFVRAQRSGQSRPIPLLKFPRKAPPHIHNFLQILEYCHHFVADEKPQGGNGDPDNTLQGKLPLLVLLTGNEAGTADDYKEFSITGAAQAAGVTVEYIGNFYSKWRQKSHKTGKKR